MDWYSWLSKSSLAEPLVDDYSLLFSHNQLEKEDVQQFDHEFLQSMGISIAKHRLEILKLAKKERRNGLLSAFKNTKKCFSKYFGGVFARCESSSAIVVVPEEPRQRHRWRGGMLKKSDKRVMALKHGVLMITNGVTWPVLGSRSASRMLSDGRKGGGGGEEEEIRWDSMFQNLRPT